MTQIVVVAGGLATRMQPVTEEIPKCLIDINGKPLILHQLEQFKKQGFREVIFCVAHLADKVVEYFGNGSSFGLDIRYVRERQGLMGTAGSVKLAQPLLQKEDFIVFYGDNLTSMAFNKFLQFHQEKGGLATICVRPLPDGYKGSSMIVLDEYQRIKTFSEKPSPKDFLQHSGETTYINSGIYAFKFCALDFISENEKYDFAKQLFPQIIQNNHPIYGYITKEFFREVGRIEKYNSFLKEVDGKKNIFD